MNQKTVVAEAAHKYGIDPKILWGLYGTETNFGHNISTSSAGAVGPFQFLPSTAKGMGVNPYDFRSAAFGAAKYLSQYKNRGVGGMLSAYNAGPAGGYQAGYVRTTLENAHDFGSGPIAQDVHSQATAHGISPEVMQHLYGSETVHGFDRAGFQKAIGRAQSSSAIASLFGGSKPGDKALAQALRIPLPNPKNFENESTVGTETSLPSIVRQDGTHPGGEPTGVVDFGGKKVAAWIAPALKYAQAHGWKGGVESGYRSLAEQTRIYNSGVRPAAKPGTSNHEGTEFPRGAVDVSEAQQLSNILRNSPYRNKLVWAGAKDPVHFSHPHNGSY